MAELKKKTSNKIFNLTYLGVTDLAFASSAPPKTQVKIGDRVKYDDFDKILENSKELCGFAILDDTKTVVGFCQLKPYKEVSTFSLTVELTYFLEPGSTGKGIGKQILDRLTVEAKQRNIEQLLASISGDNLISQKFHQKNGFVECGRFKNVGNKFGKYFDIVYMQKEL